MPISKLVFREDFRCVRCQTPLYVSVGYSRVLAVLCELISLVVLWTLGIGYVWLLLLFLPLSFVLMTVAVRVVPFIVRPRLYVGKRSTFVKLDL